MLNEYEVGVLQEARDIINEIGDTSKGVGWLAKLAGRRAGQHQYHASKFLSSNIGKERKFHNDAVNQIHAGKTLNLIGRTLARRGKSDMVKDLNSDFNKARNNIKSNTNTELLKREGKIGTRFGSGFSRVLMNAKTGNTHILNPDGSSNKVDKRDLDQLKPETIHHKW